MLYWATVFLIFGLAAAIPGFTGIALTVTVIAAVQLLVFLVRWLVSLVSRMPSRLS